MYDYIGSFSYRKWLNIITSVPPKKYGILLANKKKKNNKKRGK